MSSEWHALVLPAAATTRALGARLGAWCVRACVWLGAGRMEVPPPPTDDAAIEAELEATRAEIEALRSDLGGEPEPESAPVVAAPAIGGGEDWGFIKSGACNHGNLLGEGAGCKGVYRLTSPLTGEAFAVKLVERQLHFNAESKHSFEREVAVFNRLRHPGVCRLRTVVSEPEYHLLVVELCEGNELFDKVAAGALSEDDARGYFTQILSAVDYCHSQKVYHRDLKLENVLLKDTVSNTIKVSDFGMAKDTNVSSMPKTKRIGTIAYMAPEVADAESGYNGAAVDVWSMGVMLYVMVVCNYPFGHDGDGGDHTRTVLARIRSGTFAFPRHVRLSDDMQDLIKGMLTVDPTQRITIAEIRQHPWIGGAMDGPAEEDMPAVIDWDSAPPPQGLMGVPSLDHMMSADTDFDDDDRFNFDDEEDGFQ